jgi:hypothetical protein
VAGKLKSYVESDATRATRLIAVLVVALVVSLAIILAFAVGPIMLDDAPETSGEAPLSLVASSIVWTGEYNISFFGDGYFEMTSYSSPLDDTGISCNYSNMRFAWTCPDGGRMGPVADADTQEQLSSGTTATVERSIGMAVYPGGAEYEYILVITDILGDGMFNWGDQIAFKESPSPHEYLVEGEVNTVALVWAVNITDIGDTYVYTGFGEYSYVVEDGGLRSWKSTDLSWDQPWWE